MNDQELKAYHRGPVEFERFIMNYQSKKTEIETLQRLKAEAEDSIQRKYGVNNMNTSYEFPLPQDEMSLSSDHPSLVSGQFDLKEYSKSFMINLGSLGKRNNSSRKIMNLKKIRDLVQSKEKENSQHSVMTTAAKKDLEKTVIVKQINLKSSPKAGRRTIRNISRQMINANRVMSVQPSPKHSGTDKKINIELSIEKYRQQKVEGVSLLQKEHNSRGHSKQTDHNAPRKIQSFKNILPGNRRPLKNSGPKFSKDQSESSFFDCCQEKPKENIPPIPKLINRVVERREIKIITLKNGINKLYNKDNQGTDEKVKQKSSGRPTSDGKQTAFGTATKRPRII